MLRRGYVVLSIIATTDSSATLSPVGPLRRVTYRAYLAPAVSVRDEEGFPSLPHTCLSVSPLIPRHRPLTIRPGSVRECCLRLYLIGSADGACLLRGYVYVHFRYDPETCSPRYTGLCRWASKGNVSLTSCHPSYMALAFCHGGTCTRKCVRPFAGHAKQYRPDPAALRPGPEKFR